MLLPALLLCLVQEGEAALAPPRARQPIAYSETKATVLDGETLRRTGAHSLPSALWRAADIWVQADSLGSEAVVLRGWTGNRLAILVDGVRITDGVAASDAETILSTIDLATVDRVYIVRGPASVLFDAGATGGVIDVRTRRRRPAREADDAGWDGGAEARYVGTLEGGSLSGDASWATASDAFLGIATSFDYEDLQSGSGRVADSAFHGFGGFGAWEHRFGEVGTLRLTASAHRDLALPFTGLLTAGFGQPQPSFAEFQLEERDRRRFLLSYTGSHPTPLFDTFEARLSFQQSLEQRRVRANGTSVLRREEDEVHTVAMGIDFRRELGERNVLTWGLDADTDFVSSDSALASGPEVPGPFPDDARYSTAAFYAQDELRLPGWFDAAFGFRLSWIDFAYDDLPGTLSEDGDGSFRAWTGSLSLARDLLENVRLTGTVAQGFRAPTLDELARSGPFTGGTELANPTLSGEDTRTYELALDLRRGLVTGGIAAFYTEIDDALGRVLVGSGSPSTTGDELYFHENVGEVEVYGLELRSRLRLGLESPFAVATTAGWYEGRQHFDAIDPVSGNALYDGVPWRRIPPLNGRVALEYTPSRPRFGLPMTRAAVEVVWALSQDDLHPADVADPSVDPTGTSGWAVCNIDVGGSFAHDHGRVGWNLGLHNLFDTEYRAHGSAFDAPGFGVAFGLSWRP